MERRKIGFVTGLTAEARLATAAGFLAAAGGGTPTGAARAAETLLAQGAQALVSFGLAGGLAPSLAPGAILIPPSVIDGEKIFICDAALAEMLGGATKNPMLAGQDIIALTSEKSSLFQATNADAIDLESGAVARVAKAHGTPFAVLRAVADPAQRNLPPAALNALNAAGKINFSAILASILANPGQIPALIQVGRDAAQARTALLKQLQHIQKPVIARSEATKQSSTAL
jgi:adenosylhomocysteine nucleosidase